MKNILEVYMETKICSKCKIEKSLNEFSNDKKKSDNKRSDCKLCQKKHWNKNKVKYNIRKKQNLLELKKDEESYREYLKKQRQKNRKSWAERQGKNPEDIILNRELKKAQYLFDKEFKKLCGNSSVKKGSLFYSEILKQKRIDNPQYKLTDNLRSRIRKAMRFQWTGKKSSTAELLGMSGKEFYEYFLSLGYNKDTDTIDHIIPISRFDLTKHEHQLIACHYLNLRPLSHFENYSKSDTLLSGWQEKLVQICEVRNINPEPIIQYIESGVRC